MAYVALYRTYRPKNFGEVIGQKHIIKTLKNAVAENKTSHAYIFSGLRGIGKTTIARILARAVNCENPIDGEPCNQCKNCLAILNDETTDIVELDAASNNGVDEMREILEKVNFLPSVLRKKVYIIDDDESSIAVFRELFREDKEYKFISVKTEQIDIALKNIPSLIVINEDAIDRDVVELCRKIRKDEDNTITPVIVVSSKSEKEHRVRILQESIEYFIKKPVDEQYLYYTVKNLNRLLSSNRRVSPLTGLPGNVQIHAELKKRILRQEPFCVLYVDLDNFKAYNDVYGFLKGDEIIEFTAETIIKMVHSDELENTFVGHIGGDDFVAIVPGTNCEKLCQNIISYFDKNVERYFTEADIEKGYIEVANRKGIIEQFPLTSVSIGVVVSDVGRFHNILEIGEIGAQVKHAAKSVMGSSYAVDRRNL
mgnify:CR=1 FL=1